MKRIVFLFMFCILSIYFVVYGLLMIIFGDKLKASKD